VTKNLSSSPVVKVTCFSSGDEDDMEIVEQAMKCISLLAIEENEDAEDPLTILAQVCTELPRIMADL